METKNRETRVFDFEMRAKESEEHGHFIEGRPIVFETDTDLGYYTERINRHALDNADLKDVRFLVNHDTSMIPLARSRNNNANSTMQMEVGEEGMDIRVDLDVEGNSDAKNLYSAISRGDVSGMSFMFTVEEDKWSDLLSEMPKREILKIRKVFEVSAVTFPAYEQTSIEAASASEALERAKETLESVQAAERCNELRDQIKNLIGGNSNDD